MRYAEWKRQGFMIGSGVVEAACKTLVAQRLKLSGVSDNGDGGWGPQRFLKNRSICNRGRALPTGRLRLP